MAGKAKSAKITSRAAIEQIVLTEPRKKWTATELTELGFPLTSLAGKDPRHSFYMNVYKEAARPDGIVKRSKVAKTGKTVFTLNAKRTPAGERAKAKVA